MTAPSPPRRPRTPPPTAQSSPRWRWRTLVLALWMVADLCRPHQQQQCSSPQHYSYLHPRPPPPPLPASFSVGVQAFVTPPVPSRFPYRTVPQDPEPHASPQAGRSKTRPRPLSLSKAAGEVSSTTTTATTFPDSRNTARTSKDDDSSLPVHTRSSVTLSPLQVSADILSDYDHALAHEEAADGQRTAASDPYTAYQASTYLQRPVCLATALQRLRQALPQAVSRARLAPHGVLRLEQPVWAATTDPLAWLSAQVEAGSSSDSILNKAPLFYIGDVGATEAAVLGSVRTVYSTDEVFDTTARHRAWPPGTRWYGGQPFAPDQPRRGPWTAWSSSPSSSLSSTTAVHNATSTAWWILPAVELRHEPRRRGSNNNSTEMKALLAVHVTVDTVSYVQALLDEIDARQCAPLAPTTLPPILSRDNSLPDSIGDNVHDGQDLYEQAVQEALHQLEDDKADLQKVVLARPQQLHFGVPLAASSLLRRWKYGGHEGGTLFWMRPEAPAASSSSSYSSFSSDQPAPDFCGCTPERLFSVRDQVVSTEALAGTRPRGSTAAADAALCQELFDSPKDMAENQITGDYIVDTLRAMEDRGWVQYSSQNNTDHDNRDASLASRGASSVFVRRLRHLQHICHSYKAAIVSPEETENVTRYLLKQMHPTPAVCGVPVATARQFIQQHESVGFDRGFYAGPVGYLGQDQSDMVVAIRSGIIQHNRGDSSDTDGKRCSTLTLYAGAGIVPGSTVKGEWAETNYKLAVVGSLFPQSPFSLQGSHTPNTAWAAAFVEELIRTGVTQFYICPGSRSTPLVVAVARALRVHMGVVHAESVHDERAAAFRALGYARGAGRPAAVITSSGTAVANLYPAVVEASMDGVPMLLLTADRPYESRSTGANQAIDQVGIFSSSYVRWARDIPPPSDEVPISLVLSDVDHAVDTAKRLRGPVHLNIQFRENLAPDGGRIRNDDRVDAITTFNAYHFTSTPKFQRWSMSGNPFTKMLEQPSALPSAQTLQEVAKLIESSRRGVIVVGNVRPSTAGHDHAAVLSVLDSISDFANHIGFPIFAGVQSAALRFRSTAVVPFAEHLLRSPIVKASMKPDLIIQIGAPLVSTELPSLIRTTIGTDESANHILLHPHGSHERFDPDFTVTHRISADIIPWLSKLEESIQKSPSSELVNMISLGRHLRSNMKEIVRRSVSSVSTTDKETPLSEPEIILELAERIQISRRQAIFLSNSMPIRDAEAFLYPLSGIETAAHEVDLSVVGSNRGASGIDGIISTAKGLAEFCRCPTTLLLGDVSTMHDLSSLHALANEGQGQDRISGKDLFPLTIIVVNNDGGGIFSFLPIASHGDVNFDEFFGTPTNSFDFKMGAEAFGIPCTVSSDRNSFRTKFGSALGSNQHSLIEARVTDRKHNVGIHGEISSRTKALLEETLKLQSTPLFHGARLFQKSCATQPEKCSGQKTSKRTLLLLHGWMGDGAEWSQVSKTLTDQLSDEWSIVILDLPGHGKPYPSSMRSFKLDSTPAFEYSVETMARAILTFLREYQGIETVDAVAGYSLGGRVALAMQDIGQSAEFSGILGNTTKLILLGSAPRVARSSESIPSEEEKHRLWKDERLCDEILRTSRLGQVRDIPLDDSILHWANFVNSWYEAPLWGDLKTEPKFGDIRYRRSRSLHLHSADLAGILKGCSPPRDFPSTRICELSNTTLFMAGERDAKYSSIGDSLSRLYGVQKATVADSGHALLVEAPEAVGNAIATFLLSTNVDPLPRNSDTPIKNKSPTPLTPKEAFWQHQMKEPSNFQFVPFSIELIGQSVSKGTLGGIGWGDKAKATGDLTARRGFLIETCSLDGTSKGIGEATPLEGVHTESVSEVAAILDTIEESFRKTGIPEEGKDHENILKLDGSLSHYLDSAVCNAVHARQARSLYAALEMTVLGLASHASGIPALAAMAKYRNTPINDLKTSIHLNGIVLRRHNGQSPNIVHDLHRYEFPSIKVKVGHQDISVDRQAILDAFEQLNLQSNRNVAKLRLDANRAWNETEAMERVASLEGLDSQAFARIEYIEEPLQKQVNTDFGTHVHNLERLYRRSVLSFALDESLADLCHDCDYDFEKIKPILQETFSAPRGCAAFVLKPTLLGLELAMQLATLARKELGIGAVFTSCFESGVALAYTAMLAALSDSIPSEAPVYAHGLGTFTTIRQDTLRPAFSSHVDSSGRLNVASLSRSLFGLSLEELERDVSLHDSPRGALPGLVGARNLPPDSPEASVEASSSSGGLTSTAGKEISFAVSLDLPFSSTTAHARFTDLPQQPRWSPWLTSVAYHQGTQETQWKLTIRNIPLTWRAQSNVTYDPWPAIAWESVAGVSNSGRVEFIPTSPDACQMKVRLVARPPRILRPLFRGASIFLEDFVRDKVLKWSLEMFRDVVTADLALERGDVELGDALFEAVAGKAVAIEAALHTARPPASSDDIHDASGKSCDDMMEE